MLEHYEEAQDSILPFSYTFKEKSAPHAAILLNPPFLLLAFLKYF